jgi:ankyrin repeat protein
MASYIGVQAPPGETLPKLHEAVAKGDVTRAGKILDDGYNIDARDCQDATCLHFYCCAAFMIRDASDCVMIEYLLSRGANIEALAEGQNTPLHLAAGEAGQGRLSTVQCLVKHNANLEAMNEEKCVALHYAARENHTAIVKCLLDAGANTEAKNGNKMTPLHVAVFNNRIGPTKLLLDHGANINNRSKESNTTVLMTACSTGNLVMAKMLIEAGADQSLTCDAGRTAYQHARLWSNNHIADILEKKCEVCSKNGTLKCSACGIARYCSIECQKNAWKKHKKECKKLRDDVENKMSMQVEGNGVRALANFSKSK